MKVKEEQGKHGSKGRARKTWEQKKSKGKKWE